MQIRNKTSAARELDVAGETIVVEAGETVDVPADLAHGVKPTGKEGDPDYRAGTSGLLAQPDVWEAATSGKSDKSDKTPASGEEG